MEQVHRLVCMNHRTHTYATAHTRSYCCGYLLLPYLLYINANEFLIFFLYFFLFITLMKEKYKIDMWNEVISDTHIMWHIIVRCFFKAVKSGRFCLCICLLWHYARRRASVPGRGREKARKRKWKKLGQRARTNELLREMFNTPHTQTTMEEHKKTTA